GGGGDLVQARVDARGAHAAVGVERPDVDQRAAAQDDRLAARILQLVAADGEGGQTATSAGARCAGSAGRPSGARRTAASRSGARAGGASRTATSSSASRPGRARRAAASDGA